MSIKINGPRYTIEIGNELPFVLIAGPCVIENRAHAIVTAAMLRDIAAKAGVPFVYKTSWDKANRTSGDSYRGPGFAQGIAILDAVRREVGCPVLTDVHEPWQCKHVADVADVLQLPAFLYRQTDLIQAAADTGKPVNIKKGQMGNPESMVPAIDKTCGAPVILTERGTFFGYCDLVVDFRSLVRLREYTGAPVVFDATHSVQRPSDNGWTSGGNRADAVPLARAAVAVGVAGVFMEVHQDPANAPSDGPNMLAMADLPKALDELAAIDKIRKGFA